MYHQSESNNSKGSSVVLDVLPAHYNIHHHHHGQPSPPQSPNTMEYTKTAGGFLKVRKQPLQLLVLFPCDVCLDKTTSLFKIPLTRLIIPNCVLPLGFQNVVLVQWIPPTTNWIRIHQVQVVLVVIIIIVFRTLVVLIRTSDGIGPPSPGINWPDWKKSFTKKITCRGRDGVN